MDKYRADVDGLRAVAIVPVLLFHAGFPAFRGGFVGVDIFFVISGFLITGLILPDVVQGTFSIRSFYERRIRRIFPALFTVLLFCTLVAAVLLLPRDFASFGDSPRGTDGCRASTPISRRSWPTLGLFIGWLFLFGFEQWHLYLAAGASIVASLEELALLRTLPEWRADVRGLWWVLREGRKG